MKIIDNNGDEYTIEEAAQWCIDERCNPDTYFPSATQEHKEDISREMAYILNEGFSK